jgi:hypothetical protein
MDPQLQTMIDNMPAKTGKPLEDWLKILAGQSFEKHTEAVKFLKSEYGMTHGFANTIVHLSKSDQQPEDLVEVQYRGKEGLKPIYDKLIDELRRFGSDVEMAPKKAYVSVRRSKQFALIQPSTKSRIDVGINLAGTQPSGRLELSGSFNGMVSHRVRLTSEEEVDEELIKWIKMAYDKA